MDAVRIAPKALLLLGSILALTAAKRPVPPPPTPVAAPVPPSIKQGVELWRAGDYPGAAAMWQPFATAGDADAMFNMGQAYKLGRGVPADAAVARDWYRKAAAKGHLPAQANLGIALFQAGEKPESIKWLKAAANRGEARAQYVLGIAAFNGDGVPRSQSLGYAYLLRAQASGLPQAATALGSITPGLAPVDRSAGEAIAASLAVGTGVPAMLATTTAPRSIAPVRTPPTAAEIAAMRPPLPASAPAPVPAPVAIIARTIPAPVAQVPALRPIVLAATPPKAAPPVVAARPIPEPTPAQADAAAKIVASPAFGPVTPAVRVLPPAPAAIATTDVPAFKPVTPVPAKPMSLAKPLPVASIDPLAPVAAKPVAAPTKPVATAALKAPDAAALKPFETVDKPVVKKPDGWRVQLGAFSARKLADAAWADVKVAAAPAKPIFATDGPVTKLQMGPFATRDAAKAACAKLTEAGRACFVTAG